MFVQKLTPLPTDNDAGVSCSFLVLEGVKLLPLKYVRAEVRNPLCCSKNLCEQVFFLFPPTLSSSVRILTVNLSQLMKLCS